MFNSYCIPRIQMYWVFSRFVMKHGLSVNEYYLETTRYFFFVGDFICYIQPVIFDSSDVSDMTFCKWSPRPRHYYLLSANTTWWKFFLWSSFYRIWQIFCYVIHIDVKNVCNKVYPSRSIRCLPSGVCFQLLHHLHCGACKLRRLSCLRRGYGESVSSIITNVRILYYTDRAAAAGRRS